MRKHKGIIKKKLVYGVGINDADYKVQVAGWKCPFYERWKGMLRRAYSAKLLKICPTYLGTTVDPGWHRLSLFTEWMEQQDYRGMSLDKDILFVGNKHYSPETCVFVPQRINSILLDSGSIRGDHPLGVCYRENIKHKPYYSSLRDVERSKVYLGYHETPEKAHKAWQLAKAVVIEKAVQWWAQDVKVKHTFNTRAAAALLARVWVLRLDHHESVITEIL